MSACIKPCPFTQLFSIDRIGVATSSAIIDSNPLISKVLAIAFLGEEVNHSTFLGASMVMVGVLVISWVKGRFQWGGGILIAITSAFSYALSNVIRNMGLNIQPLPVLGGQVSSVAGALGFLLYLASTRRLSTLRVDKRCTAYFTTAGLVSSVGWVTLLRATEMGKVSVVTTIVFSYPLFSILLTWLFLREEITTRLIVGCLTIVLGVIVVSRS
ncbi:MAG: DMT family transporter [Candidatus Bathyarchaeia archaeon]